MGRLTPHVGGVPRGFPDHRRRAAQEYRRVCRLLAARWPTLPPGAEIWVREAALATLELGRLATDLEGARARGRLRLANSIRKQQLALRSQLANIEDRLASLTSTSTPPPPSVEDLIAAARRPHPPADTAPAAPTGFGHAGALDAVHSGGDL